MEEIVRKGMRLRRPQVVRLDLRPEVSEFFEDLASISHCGARFLMRGVLEDFYDSHKDLLPEEVINDEEA